MTQIESAANSPWRLLATPLCIAAILTLGSCTGFDNGALPAGLTARMDAPGANLDRSAAIAMVNHFRANQGVNQVSEDADLDARAQALAAQYAQAGKPPASDNSGPGVVRYSAGYSTFADTFSGWRNAPEDAGALARPGVTRAGLGVAYVANSAYGVYWVLIMSGNAAQ